MTIHVPDLMVKFATAKGGMSPLDVVMGEDWGELDLGTSMRLSLLRHSFNQMSNGAAVKGGGSAMARRPHAGCATR